MLTEGIKYSELVIDLVGDEITQMGEEGLCSYPVCGAQSPFNA